MKEREAAQEPRIKSLTPTGSASHDQLWPDMLHCAC